jgi:hypothetical protein
MTSAQALWLKANPPYQAMGRLGGRHIYGMRGTLKPDGEFVPYSRQHTIKDLISAFPGAFGVGILEEAKPGQIADPRYNYEPMNPITS